MNDNGYVYVLMNPSLQNMVKIGKTTREPEERAKELSTATGVPTPFVVVYSCLFESCTEAEAFVHTYLESKGFRVASNREFFEIPINLGIDAVIKAKEHLGEFTINNYSKPSTNEKDVKNEKELVDLYKTNILPEIKEYIESLEIDSDKYSFCKSYIQLIDNYIESKFFILSTYNIANLIEFIEPLNNKYSNKFKIWQESSVDSTDISTALELFNSLIENHEHTINSIENASKISLLNFLYELVISMKDNEQTNGMIAVLSEYIELVEQKTDVSEINENPKNKTITNEPWYDVFIEATNYFNGENGYFQDYSESIKYFKQAVKLGSGIAYSYLGMIYEYGLGTKIDLDLALSCYRDNLNKGGNISSYQSMAGIYLKMNHIDNAIKCWEKFLDNINHENMDEHTLIDGDFSSFILELKEINQLVINKVKIKNISDKIYALKKAYLEEIYNNKTDDVDKHLTNIKFLLYNDVIKFTNSDENNGSIKSKFSLASLFGFK